MEKVDLTGINKVRFKSYSEYEDVNGNGKSYSFFTDYIRVNNDKWKISYGTTSDKEYCPVCGTFINHYKGDNCKYKSGYGCGEYVVITEDDLLTIMNDPEELKYGYFETAK